MTMLRRAAALFLGAALSLAACDQIGAPAAVTKTQTVRQLLSPAEVEGFYGAGSAMFDRPDQGDSGRFKSDQFYLSTATINITGADSAARFGCGLDLSYGLNPDATSADYYKTTARIEGMRHLTAIPGLGAIVKEEAFEPDDRHGSDHTVWVLAGDRQLHLSCVTYPQTLGGRTMDEATFQKIVALVVPRLVALKLPDIPGVNGH